MLHIHRTKSLKHYLQYPKYAMLIKALVDYNIWCLHMVHNTIYITNNILHSEYEDIIIIILKHYLLSIYMTNIHIGILGWRTHIYIFKGMVRQEQEWEYKYLLSWWDSSHTLSLPALNASSLHCFNFLPYLTFHRFIASPICLHCLNALTKKNIKA